MASGNSILTMPATRAGQLLREASAEFGRLVAVNRDAGGPRSGGTAAAPPGWTR